MKIEAGRQQLMIRIMLIRVRMITVKITPIDNDNDDKGSDNGIRDLETTTPFCFWVATVTTVARPRCHQPHWTRRFNPFTHEKEVSPSPSMRPPPSRTRLVALDGMDELRVSYEGGTVDDDLVDG
ncbi:uncharacterized protein HKW66_Vig0155350 [Vigna angularis]|uniref:Uncharacterized protein n=1 Tax=Phaseolus angularis TaxID=3914 RepID=A0A8T0JK49_PHAAN|nr:uncharacterized protein HKW66_Vig0155350 [Vigna angularis]